MKRLLVAALVAAGSLASVAVEAAPPDGPKVVVEAPTAGVRRRTFPVRVRIEPADGAKTVELLRLRPQERRPERREKVVPMKQLQDGRWGLDQVELPGSNEALVVRARAGDGAETRLELKVVDETGWQRGGPELYAPGTPLESTAEARTLGGKKVELAPRAGPPTLVVFYGAWNDCAREIAWARGMLERFGPKGLVVIGVGSVAPADVDAWRAYLKERGATWEHVVDADGALAKVFWMSPRKAPGNEAGAVVYAVKDGKVVGGDYVDPAYIDQVPLSTTEGLAKALP